MSSDERDSASKSPTSATPRDVDVVEVLVKPGTRVEVDQGLIVLESEKASMEVPSPPPAW